MKKSLLTLSLLAGLATCVHAQGVLGPDGSGSSGNGQYGSFFLDNDANSSTSQAAGNNGLVFLGTTAASATLLNQDVNIAVYTGGTLIVDLLLGNGTGPAEGDGTFFGGGQVYDNSGEVYYDTAAVGGSTASITIDMWSGDNVNSYAAALTTPGDYFGSVTFNQGLGDLAGTPAPSAPSDFTSMPALVMTQATPEPTTLAFAGLGGLSMLLLRRRS